MAVPTNSNLVNILGRFQKLTEQPTDFLSSNVSRSQEFKVLSKSIFDYVRTVGGIPYSPTLTELLIGEEYDDEQVWQQLELDNRLNIDTTVKNVANILVQGEPEFFGVAVDSAKDHPQISAENKKSNEESGIESQEEEDSETAEHQFDGPSDSAGSEADGDEDAEDLDDDDEMFAREGEDVDGDDNMDGENEDDDDEEEEDLAAKDEVVERPRTSGPASVLDDQFFKLSEMNDYLLEAEKQEGHSAGTQDVDYFADDDEERDEDDYRYDDFFDSPSDQQNPPKISEKSTFEKRQEKLQDRIKEMEEEAMAEKPWQLGGEVSAIKRPENSLLEEFLQFDHVTRQPPVITEEVSLKLEDIIIQRIKDKAWDDVERKVKPKDVDPYEYKKKLVLEETKAKQSLSQIYEQEYLKKIATVDKDEEKEEHRKIRKMMSELFVKLDALSNFHFVPKPVAPDIRIVNNLPTLVVEEVQPSTVATSQLLAPEEVQAKKKGELTGLSEATATDKNRSRRKKKLLQKVRGQHQKEKKEGLEKVAKKAEKRKVKGGSSGAFFDKLQDTVKAESATKSADGKESKKRKKGSVEAKSVKKFKL